MYNILILDDDPDIVNSLTELFLKQGFQVYAAVNVQEFYLELEKKIPDIFLIDVILGKEDGREVCKKLKSEDNFKNKLILLMSGVYNFHAKSAGNPVFADDYIDKPFNTNLLLEKNYLLMDSE